MYKNSNGTYSLRFGGTVQHYEHTTGFSESLFVAQTQLVVDGKVTGTLQTAGFAPGEAVITVPNVVHFGFTNTLTVLSGLPTCTAHSLTRYLSIFEPYP